MDTFLQDMQAEVVYASIKIPYATETAQKAMFSVWDFGGQHVYYTSHQTFLSQRAVYVLVMDVTKSLDTKIEHSTEDDIWKDTGTPKTARG